MANDLLGGLGGLGGLVKGLSSFMPQDDPEVKLMNAQVEVGDLQKKKAEILAEIGAKAVAQYGIDSFGDLGNQLKLVETNLAAAQGKLQTMQEEKSAQEAAAKAEQAKTTCPECGTFNPEGTKFCQECGAKLGAPEQSFCSTCGAEMKAGARFCGACGAQQ